MGNKLMIRGKGKERRGIETKSDWTKKIGDVARICNYLELREHIVDV